MADELVLFVNGRGYSGFKSIRVTRSMESIAGSFDLEVTDRWGDNEPWPIAEEDECRIEINGNVVIDGYIDKPSLSVSGSNRTVGFSGRDRAAELVDNACIVEEGTVSKNKWTFTNLDLFELAKKIAAPHGVPVSVQPGLQALLPRNKRVVVSPGDTCFEVLSRVAAVVGVMLVSDGRGGVVITRASSERATSLVEGQNMLSADSGFDASDRFHRYLISSQVPGTDEASGEATRVRAEAIDNGVRRKNRVTIIRPDKGYNTRELRARADWEARIRAARAEKVTVGVQGWEQPSGKLWAINTVTRVKAPRSIRVDGDMRISQVDFVVGGGGTLTQLGLVRPDAFTPEPSATVKDSGGAWKELAKGAL